MNNVEDNPNEIHLNEQSVVNRENSIQSIVVRKQYKSIYKKGRALRDLMIGKFFLCFMFVLSIGFLTNFQGFMYHQNLKCFEDRVQINLFGGLNFALANHVQVKNFLVLLGSVGIDLSILSAGSFWAVCGKSWVFPTSTIMFYLSREIVQMMYLMKIPHGELFGSPGFPSLFVPYMNTNDFFYSGHVGLPILMGFELRKLRYWLFFVCLGISIYECFVMISTRGHYSIDLLFGYVYVFYSILVCRKLSYYLDRWIHIGNDPYEEETSHNGSEGDFPEDKKNR